MSAEWHRSEPREVRPFFQTKSAEHALEGSKIRLFKDADSSSDSKFDINEADFERLEPTFFPSIARSDLQIPEDFFNEIDLVIIGRQAVLKRSQVIARWPIHSPIPDEFAVPRNALVELGGGRGTEFTLALCLTADHDRLPGLPFVMGHWIASKTFSMRSLSTPAVFDVQPRTDEEWVAAGYPAKTLFVVDYLGGIELEADLDSSVARVWLHADAYSSMIGSAVGPALEPMISVETILTILQTSLVDWKSLETPPPNSPLATVLRQLSKSGRRLSLSDLRDFVQQPSKLRAHLQDQLQVVRAITR